MADVGARPSLIAAHPVLAEVAAERKRQDVTWGGPEHDDGHTNTNWTIWLSFIDEHNRKAYSGENSPEAYRNARRRFIEVAALAVAAVESFDREVGEEMRRV